MSLRMFDYRCLKCRKWTEWMIDCDPIPETMECACGGVSERRWRRAPGVVGNGEYYSDQLQMQFSSKKAFERHCKERGMHVLGKEEWNRTQYCMPTGEAESEKERDEQLIASMKDSWERTIIGNEKVSAGEPIDITPSDVAVGGE